MRWLRAAMPWALACCLALAGIGPAAAAEVVVLRSVDTPAWLPVLQALRERTSDQHLVEVGLGGNRAKGEQTLRGLKGRNVILVALGPLATQLCVELAPELPMAYGLVPHPDEIPGLSGAANAAGVTYQVPVKNQLAAFRMVNPRAVKVGVVHSTGLASEVDEAEKAAGILRLTIVAKSVASERDVPDAVRDLLGHVDALWVPADPLLVGENVRRFLLAETLKHSKPIYAFSAALVDEGALVSDGASLASVGRQLGEIVNRIASGEAPSSIGDRVPAAELVINKKVADQLNIEIPADALRAAARVH